MILISFLGALWVTVVLWLNENISPLQTLLFTLLAGANYGSLEYPSDIFILPFIYSAIVSSLIICEAPAYFSMINKV